jgi:hypothetical protein
MIGESHEWALWVMVALLALIMLLPTIKPLGPTTLLSYRRRARPPRSASAAGNASRADSGRILAKIAFST